MCMILSEDDGLPNLATVLDMQATRHHDIKDLPYRVLVEDPLI